ncbi:unnamed protein product [Cylicostephanus goldi]|uniref:GRIP domain-containing protein n=1 Tax=Cylicostephanus goldi TaxID=71465 RepID=A0A3P6RS83_CYLGO|nr:unnamed protein product [Cylicostephanus goldi]
MAKAPSRCGTLILVDGGRGIARRRSNVVAVHESPRPFDRTSTHESVACRVLATPPVKRGESEPERRSRSEQRKRSSPSRPTPEAKSRRRSVKKNIPPSLSSSITSDIGGDWFGSTAQQKDVPQMSQSWHEASANKTQFESQPTERSQTSRRESRTISLRERVGQLGRENRFLKDQLAIANAALASARKVRPDNDRLTKLEQEKDALREKVELLLQKIDQDSTSACAAVEEANARLELSRNENMMYEKKIRDMEEERREMYLVMFKKGQEAAAMDLKEVAHVDQMTQDRVVLRFLHDAFYYYLMNKGDAKEHLQAIMTMLDFSVEQKDEVAKKKGRSF